MYRRVDHGLPLWIRVNYEKHIFVDFLISEKLKKDIVPLRLILRWAEILEKQSFSENYQHFRTEMKWKYKKSEIENVFKQSKGNQKHCFGFRKDYYFRKYKYNLEFKPYFFIKNKNAVKGFSLWEFFVDFVFLFDFDWESLVSEPPNIFRKA